MADTPTILCRDSARSFQQYWSFATRAFNMAGRFSFFVLAALLPTLAAAQASNNQLTEAFLNMPACGVSHFGDLERCVY